MVFVHRDLDVPTALEYEVLVHQSFSEQARVDWSIRVWITIGLGLLFMILSYLDAESGSLYPCRRLPFHRSLGAVLLTNPISPWRGRKPDGAPWLKFVDIARPLIFGSSGAQSSQRTGLLEIKRRSISLGPQPPGSCQQTLSSSSCWV